jgi:predicted MPP superfamily phosphohydrolase
MSPVCWVAWLYWKWLPLIVVGIIMLGFIQSMIDRKEYVYFSAATAEEHDRNGIFNNNLHRKSVDTWHDPIDTTGKRVLRIAQITDPHVGVWMSHERLRHICKTIAAWNPDLVFITGDIVTVESYFEKEKFVRAFEPLSHLQGRLYGCLGNHDYEAQAMVEEMLREVGVTLLKDEDGIANTPIGPVQIVGTEFYWERAKAAKAQKIAAVARKFHEKEHFRIWLVHNPGDFQYFPDGSVDLMFSGHTHGGQLGLQTFGIPFTFFWLFTRSPDYGLWQKGSNLLYVHRGTGYQGFPVRLGVDGELSLVTVFV